MYIQYVSKVIAALPYLNRNYYVAHTEVAENRNARHECICMVGVVIRTYFWEKSGRVNYYYISVTGIHKTSKIVIIYI